jgi:hypothetical protein
MPKERPVLSTVLIVFMALYSIMGLASGALVLSDTSGASLGLPEDVVDSLPVDDLLLVGLWLFVVWGMVPAILCYGLLRRPRWAWTGRLNGWTGMHWSWSGTVGLLVLLYIWLAVETYFIGFEAPIQYITLIIGLVMTILSLAPGVRRYYSEGPGRLSKVKAGP